MIVDAFFSTSTSVGRLINLQFTSSVVTILKQYATDHNMVSVQNNCVDINRI
jgi:hypothetical protein